MAQLDSALHVTGLTKTFGTAAKGLGGGIRPISFDLPSGTFFTLLGPSGCGKTTTLRCIAGLEQPDDGTIKIGNDIFFDAKTGANIPLDRRNIGMVFQSYAIWPHMTVAQNVGFPLRVARDQSYSAEETKRLVGEALETVNLAGFQTRSPTQLSGGQQQRVALARAIVRRPRLLLLDEPLSNLDAMLRDEMRNELKSLQRQIGVTTIYVTHDQSEALEMSDVIAILNHGNLIQMGSPRDIYYRPHDSFVAGFMGSTNLLQGKVPQGAAANSTATVTLTTGQSVTCRFPSAIGAGMPVAVSVRPETISLTARGAAVRDTWNRIDGTVISSGFLGHTNRYMLRVGDLILQANTSPDTDLPAGQDVSISFSAESAVGLATAAEA